MLDQLADNWFGVCNKHIADELGKGTCLQRSGVGSRAYAGLCIPVGHSDVRCFNLGDRTWDVLKYDYMNVYVSHDGTVEVGYRHWDQADKSMCFKVGHPREVSELFQLLANPVTHLRAETDARNEPRKLSDIAEFHVLIADEKTWRIMDPASLPPETPEDFKKSLYCGVVRDWDNNFPLSETSVAWQDSARWQDFLTTLPLAAPFVEAGYFLDPDGNAESAVDHAVLPPTTGVTTIDLLMVPRRSGVSSLYLREYLDGDKEASQKVREAFSMGSDFGTLMESIRCVELSMPIDPRDQVRIAAEHNAIRQWLSSVAGSLASQKGCFLTMAEKHCRLAYALGEMRDQFKSGE